MPGKSTRARLNFARKGIVAECGLIDTVNRLNISLLQHLTAPSPFAPVADFHPLPGRLSASPYLPPPSMAKTAPSKTKRPLLRKPLLKREAQIIKRMKSLAELPVTTIAKVVQRDKKSVYKVMGGKASFSKRGRKEKLRKKDVDHLVRTVRA